MAMTKTERIARAVEYFDALSPKEQERIKNECPDSWKKTDTDFYDWVSDIYSKQIQIFLTPLTYQDIVKDPKNQTELKCINAHGGMESIGFGRTKPYFYKLGAVVKRNLIVELKPANWEINKP